ncbi:MULTISPECIES: hypothetical protein [unclassified Variovorax]|uniref:hypothetical protein n=1 Tax=unclassified Variovorax TaxID=663243 RepID=UPI00083837C1|nr:MULTISPECIES: hypothetical protein [unclassified Variovorax]PNG50116.1 hypothetical protein CHC06_05739 [Variovorax sp. B2]PNG50989.1 hypothetical protein CHC07_05645 [Variovorax sp. B4]VTV17151.1 hypothetical protein WDL1P1_00154 [Variovorax sp. WDL1]
MAKLRTKSGRAKSPAGRLTQDDLLRSIVSSLADKLMSDQNMGIGDSDAAKDVLFLEENCFPQLCRQAVAEAEFEPEFPPRIQVVRLTGLGDEGGWAGSLVEPGDPSFISGGPDGIRARMASALRRSEATRAVALWVCPYRVGGPPARDLTFAFAFLRHTDGLEQIYLVSESGFMRVPSNARLRASALDTMLEGYGTLEERMEPVMGAVENALVQARPKVEAEFATCKLPVPALSEAQWTLLVRSLLAQEEWRHAVEALCREAVGPAIGQATNLAVLVGKLSEELAAALNRLESRATQELDLSRDKQFRKLQADLEKAQMIATGAQERARRIEAENQEIRRAGGAARSHAPPEPGPGKGLGEALVDLFG